MSSDPFKAMAEEIDHNAAANFGGGFVIVPPGGEPLRMLFLSPSPDQAIFWGTLRGVVDMALAEIAQQQGGQFAPRR
jgi:hypothetical protein